MLRKLAAWISDPVTQDVIAALGAVLILDSFAQLARRVAVLEAHQREHCRQMKVTQHLAEGTQDDVKVLFGRVDTPAAAGA